MSTFLCFPVAPASTPFLTRRSAAFSTETKRLAALHSYQVLDTPDEAAFDDLTHLASYIAGTPVALISLIDTDRQWFKARVGTEVDKIPRDQAFCHYTIQGEGPLEVPDTHLDERFLNNPLVTGNPHIRYYCGVPLTSPEGYRLGSLCVIDNQPRQLNPQQLRALETLAREVMARFEMKRQQQELQEQKRRLASSEARYRILFEESAGYLFTHDLEGNILTVNDAAAQALGYAKGDLTGKNISGLLKLGESRLLKEYFQRMEAGTAVNGVTRVVTTNGEERYWQYRNFGVRHASGELVVICSAQDVTEKELAATNLLKSKKVLEEQIRARTEDLQATNAALIRTKDDLDMFLYRASHDLKGPLCSLEGLLNLAQMENSPEQQKEFMQLMQQTVQKLNRVLESLLTYAINTHWGVAEERIDFQALLKQALQTLRLQPGFGRLRITPFFNTLVPFYSDPDRVLQVLISVIRNSIAFQDLAQEESQLNIWINSTKEGAAILIQDNGSGIDEAQLPALFQPFSKASEHSQGSGLGLFISREILRKLGGSITLQSQKGRGTQVNIKIPAARQPDPAE